MSKTSLFVFAILLFAIVFIEFTDGLTVLTLHEQCISMGFAGICRKSWKRMYTDSPSRCSMKLACAVQVGHVYYKQTGELPLDGTACGKNMMCKNGRCIGAAPGIVYAGLDIIRPCRAMVPIKYQITPKIPPRHSNLIGNGKCIIRT